MNTITEQRLVRTVLAASIAAIFSMPAWADDEIERLIRPDSHIELGLGYVSDDNVRFGNYTGLNDSGAHLIGNFLINKRGEGNARYVEIEGSNLGLDSRGLGIRAGEQGNYGLRLQYDQIPFYSNSFSTPYNGAGSAVLTRPAGVARNRNAGGMTGLAANLKPYDIDTVRKGLGLGFTKQLGRDWDVEMNYKREKKDGDKLTAAMMQILPGGGTRGAVFVPEPVDYTTDQYEALVRYTGEKLQLQFGYNASIFRNDNKSLTWDNLFDAGNATGRFGLPPDNEFHQINASGSYAISSVTRLSGSLSYGRMTQNDAFLPYATGAVQAVPASGSLNGKVNTTHASLKLNTKLMPKLNLTAGMRYDDRDNKTPIAQFRYITGDVNTGVLGSGAVGSANDRRNIPLDIKKQVLYADLDYHLASATTLKFGYDFHKVDHNYEPTTGDKEHTVKTEVRQRFGETVTAGLSYAYSDRDASAYNGAAPLASTYSQAYLNTLFGGTTGKTYAWLEAPTLRKSYLADRKRDKVGAFASFAPTDRLDLDFGAHITRDKYPDTFAGIGLTRAIGWMASFDATLQATDALTGNFFASLDQYKTDQNGAHLPDAARAAAAESGAIPAAYRAVTTLSDRTLTVGVGARYKPVRNYEVGGNLTHSDSVGRSTFVAGSAVPIGPLPDLVSRLNRLDLFGSYMVQKDVKLNLKYAYERYRAKDWAWDAPLTLTSVTSVVGPNLVSPNYNVHFIGVSMDYRF